jgi:hypothetical protein
MIYSKDDVKRMLDEIRTVARYRIDLEPRSSGIYKLRPYSDPEGNVVFKGELDDLLAKIEAKL